jgi:hypothetical protein
VKRVLLLMLAAAVVVWAGALFDFQGGTRHPDPLPRPREAEAMQPAQQQSVPVAAKRPAQAADQHAEPVLPPPPLAKVPAEGNAPSPVAHGPLQVIGKVARAFLTVTRGAGPPPAEEQPVKTPEATGELGEGVLSPEYTELERHYVEEPRDGEWAVAQEQRIRELFRDQPLAEKVAIVNCQQTVCRIVLETGSNDGWQQLLQVPGLTQQTKLAPQSPYSLRSGQLSVYFHP